MDAFYEKVRDPPNFSDMNCRAVIITGIPFPPRMDPKVSCSTNNHCHIIVDIIIIVGSAENGVFKRSSEISQVKGITTIWTVLVCYYWFILGTRHRV